MYLSGFLIYLFIPNTYSAWWALLYNLQSQITVSKQTKASYSAGIQVCLFSRSEYSKKYDQKRQIQTAAPLRKHSQ